MKIIGRSNYGLESVNDILVCDNITNKQFGEVMASALNQDGVNLSGYVPYYFALVEDSYELYKFQP